MSSAGPRGHSSWSTWSATRRNRPAATRSSPVSTGLAQVPAATRLAGRTRLSLDVEYVERRSFRLDIEILRRTIGAVAGPVRDRRGCERDHDRVPRDREPVTQWQHLGEPRRRRGHARAAKSAPAAPGCDHVPGHARPTRPERQASRKDDQMCGSSGFVGGSGLERDVIDVLAHHAEQRGRDSSGVLLLGKHGYQLHRADYPIPRLLRRTDITSTPRVLRPQPARHQRLRRQPAGRPRRRARHPQRHRRQPRGAVAGS